MAGTPLPNIPLQCRICPKKPDFSDVSHLLTHVASKSHLSNYYKMKVQGSADPRTRDTVDAYDEWYELYGIDDLMRERLNQKERKNGGGRNGAASAAPRRAAGANSTSARSTPSAAARRNNPRPLRDSVLNPQLDTRVKIEPPSRSATPNSSSLVDLPMYPLPQCATNPTWLPSVDAYPILKQEALSSSRSDDDDNDDDYDIFTDSQPSHARRWTRNRRQDDGSNDSFYLDDDCEIGETTTDAAKLKGVLWPGMAMFDSATPEMRRKRNQKKDYSVIEQLKATSEFVEPTEMIFDELGVFRKQREITGNAELEDDDSLLSGEIEPEPVPMPKKRATRKPRAPLTERNPNNGRSLRRRAGSHHPPFGGHRPNTPYFDGITDDDYPVYAATRSKRQRTGLSIHRDDSGPDITFAAPTSLQLSGAMYRNPIQIPQTHYIHNEFGLAGNVPRGHQRLPSLSMLGGLLGDSTFRTSMNSGGMLGPGAASFGQLHHQFPFTNNVQTSNSSAAAFNLQQQLGSHNTLQQHQQSYPTTNGGDMLHLQNDPFFSNDVDIFSGFGHVTHNNFHSPQQSLGHGFQNSGELANPLFLSSNQAAPQDDEEATVSAPGSEENA